MAEVLLRHHLGEASAEVMVSSAGLYRGGRSATAHGQAVMADRHLDLSRHRSRRLDRTLIERADLVIGMAREHVREAVVLDPGGLTRTFTLKELVRLASAEGRRPDDEPLARWLARLGATRRSEALMGEVHDDAYDVEDPVGRGRAAHESTARELDHLLALLVALAWPRQIIGK